MTTTRFKSTILVSDGAVAAAHVDPNLKNAWGIAFNPKGFVWVANNGTQTATLYDGNGVPQTLVVTIPAVASGTANPTGIVFNGSTDFVVSSGGKSGAAPFIFAGEGGTLSAWSPGVGPTTAFTVFDGSSANAVYKGLALAASSSGNRLYAADFHNSRVDVFDKNFAKLTLPSGAFQDTSLPAGFAPFGIQAIGAKIYVAYAKQDTEMHDEEDGAGLGAVDVFDTDGNLLQRLAQGGPLNAPWGMTQAPANFGSLSNDILVGNFGDGTISAFDPANGKFIGKLTQPDGSNVVQPGLWGIAFGNGLSAQPTNTLFFAAGPNHEADGAYGRLDMQ
jgi:uncharacterized protein (TIGR03118 family)